MAQLRGAGAALRGSPLPLLGPHAAAVAAALLLGGIAAWVLARRGGAARAPRREQPRRRGDAKLSGRWSDWFEPRYPLEFRFDAQGRPLELSDRLGAFPDLNPSQWLGARFDERLGPEHRAELRARVERVLAGTPQREPVRVLARGLGREARWLELWLRADPDSGGSAVDAIGRDVTERLQSELERSVQGALDAEWLANAPIETVLARALRALAEALGCQYAELWWLDERYEVLHAGECWHAGSSELENFARRSRNRSFGKGVGLAGRVWASTTPVRIDDLAQDPDPRCARLARIGPFASALGIPVRIGDRFVGSAVLLSSAQAMAPVGSERLEQLGAHLGRLVERKRSERVAQENEARKNAMLESALDCVITIDEEGRITEFNPAAEKTFGRVRSEVLGKPMAELLMPEEDRERFFEAFARCLGPGAERPEGARLEREALRGDGERFPVEISVTSIHVGDSPSFTAYIRDITERKDLDRMKDELVSTVSHELRTPLTSMRGFVELMLSREFPADEQRRFLEIVESEMKRLGKLIDDFLDLQRLESGHIDYGFEEVDLRPLIEEAVEMFRLGHEDHEYRVALAEGDLRVKADPDRIRQTLRNLISNATKYSPDGGEVRIGAERSGSEVRVAVRDQGIRMDEATQQKLFTRFFRADSTATRRIGGTGLGLSLVKEIVEAHGGRVGVSSRPGEGSEFHFTLPAIEGTTEAATEGPA